MRKFLAQKIAVKMSKPFFVTMFLISCAHGMHGFDNTQSTEVFKLCFLLKLQLSRLRLRKIQRIFSNKKKRSHKRLGNRDMNLNTNDSDEYFENYFKELLFLSSHSQLDFGAGFGAFGYWKLHRNQINMKINKSIIIWSPQRVNMMITGN